MSKYIFKNFPNFCAVCIILGTLFLFIFQLLSVNATRDRASERIREIEAACKQEEATIRSLDDTKTRLCESNVLRATLQREQTGTEYFMESPETIIRVRPQSIPYGAGRAPAPQTTAVELSELAALSSTKR